ncbi:hypothetical protein ACBP45_00470 [Latilactobacillus sakei]|nr:hypothetical protein [Latilactobacillus sakei]
MSKKARLLAVLVGIVCVGYLIANQSINDQSAAQTDRQERQSIHKMAR